MGIRLLLVIDVAVVAMVGLVLAAAAAVSERVLRCSTFLSVSLSADAFQMKENEKV